MSKENSNQPMKWTDEHDVHFLKELLNVQPWLRKKGSTDRGEIWANLAIALCQSRDLSYRVTQRSLRDRYLLLERRYKKRVAEEERASGISPELSEVDVCLEEIVSLFQEADQAETTRKRRLVEEAQDIEEMRQASLETLRESRERRKDGKELKKKRTSGADSLSVIREKVEKESERHHEAMEVRKEEIELKKEEMKMERELREAEMELRRKEHEERVQQQQATTRFQEQQLQQLQNMNMAMLQQQQQQNQVLLTLLQKFAEK